MTEQVLPVALLETRSGHHAVRVRTARGFGSRFRGLMLRRALPWDEGMLLTECPSVHTMFMRFPIDVVYLDRQGMVTRCVPALQPWRASMGSAGRDAAGARHARPAHVLELAAGAIARWKIAPGDRLRHPLMQVQLPAVAPRQRQAGQADQADQAAGGSRARAASRLAQRGVAVVEFLIAVPILSVLGLGVTQYSLLFFAKNQINHAGFMAARAGSVSNADLGKVQDAYAQALVPLYGGGQTAKELADSLLRAKEDLLGHVQVTMINPTKESFNDFNDPDLQAKLKTGGKKVIPNSSLAFRSKMGATSGQSIQDANLIKLRIMQGVKPQVPVIGSVYTAYLSWLDDGKDAFRTAQITQGRIPVVSHVTLQMQSDAIEPDNPVSIPGPGNNGKPVDPGAPPTTPSDPPNCPLGGCTTPPGPGDSGTCPAASSTTLGADALFDFDKSTLTLPGKLSLDKLVASIKNQGLKIDTLTVTGYTDPLGTEEHNLKLSQARADAVANYLNGQGITASNVNVVGAGSKDLVKELSACSPKTGKDLEDCLQPNRRVVVSIKPKE